MLAHMQQFFFLIFTKTAKKYLSQAACKFLSITHQQVQYSYAKHNTAT